MTNKIKDEIIKKLEMNYNISNIRNDLISQGFSPQEVDKAIDDALKTFVENISEKNYSSKNSNPLRLYTPNKKPGMLQKVKMALISPRRLFREVSEESLGETLKYYFLLIIIPPMIANILYYAWKLSFMGFSLNSLLYLLISSMIIIAGDLIMLFYSSIIFHLGPKLLGGKKSWKHTLRVLVYSYTPIIFVYLIISIILILFPQGMRIELSNQGNNIIFILPFFAFIIGILIWSLLILIIGLSEIHEMTMIRSIIAFIISLFIFLIITIMIMIAIGSIAMILLLGFIGLAA